MFSFALSPAAAAGSKGYFSGARRRSWFDMLTTNGTAHVIVILKSSTKAFLEGGEERTTDN